MCIRDRGKLAAFASYYAPIHFLTTLQACEHFGIGMLTAEHPVMDLGCGTGAVGAAVARTLPGGASVVGVDASRAVAEAFRRTARQLNVRSRLRVGRLPKAMPRVPAGGIIVAGWSLNELDEQERSGVLERLQPHLQKGAGLLVLEPLSRRVSPWWSAVVSSLENLGCREAELTDPLPDVEWIQRLDQATGLDHRRAKCRGLWVPPK